ncbi:hypothetical protein SDC9_194150 [bioreactor metagenome]|uniref:Membrane protein YdfK n=1 Tax=bioreactor metagenome TaxID=1076179 RepID=A0A645I623_9ZZZZ
MLPIATDVVLTQVSVIGSIVIFCIGLNMLKATNIKVANLLVAVYLPLLLELVWQLKKYIL